MSFYICVFVTFLTGASLHVGALSNNHAGTRCEKWGLRVAEGQKIPVPGECKEATCTKAADNEISVEECPVFDLIPGCQVTGEDLSKTYPECCPKAICHGA